MLEISSHEHDMMDHIPLPRNATVGNLDIPFCTEDYIADGDCETYPEGPWLAAGQQLMRFTQQGRRVRRIFELGGFLQIRSQSLQDSQTRLGGRTSLLLLGTT